MLKNWNEHRLVSTLAKPSAPLIYDSDGDQIPGLMDDTESESEPEIELRTHRKKKTKPSKTDKQVKMAKAPYGLRV